MVLEKETFKAVIDIFGGIVFVGDYLVKDYAALRFNFIGGECGPVSQLEEKVHGFAEVFSQDRGMEHYFLLGGEGVELPAQAV